VTVSGPVRVLGSVEVLNDALQKPHGVIVSGNIDNNAENGFLIFPSIPAGKRLVIETVTVRATVAAGQSATAELILVAPLPTSAAFLSLQSQGNFSNGTIYVGTHAVRMRVDPPLQLQINVRRTGSGIVPIAASIYGFLEDIPTVAP
jgi:hypothetical protein